MKKLLLIVCSFVVIPTQAMEVEDGYEVLLAERFDESVQWKGLPLDLIKSMQLDPNKNKTVYTMGGSQLWHIPYALRNIDPVNLTNEDQTDVDLTPHITKPILLDTQFWIQRGDYYDKSHLCLDRVNTNDCFNLYSSYISGGSILFDGINSNRLALVAIIGESTTIHGKTDEHCVYVLHQSRDGAGKVEQGRINPACSEYGELESILLHRERNRCVRGIKNRYKNSNVSHCITIEDIVEATFSDQSPHIMSLCAKDKLVTVASLATDFVLSKAIYVGKDTYLGLTEEGNMIVFWLNSENKIECNVRQNCHGKQFKDIDVDETVKTDSGFMPRVALLATNGDVFLTDLRMGREKKVLLYFCTLENPHNIFRFFYDKGQCAVVYRKNDVSNGGNIYDTFHMWPDNFNMLLAYLSLKSSQQKVSEEEK